MIIKEVRNSKLQRSVAAKFALQAAAIAALDRNQYQDIIDSTELFVSSSRGC